MLYKESFLKNFLDKKIDLLFLFIQWASKVTKKFLSCKISSKEIKGKFNAKFQSLFFVSLVC